MTLLRWGLLSTARINRRLIPAIRAANGAELLAVASRDRDRAEAYAAEWEIPRAHGSYEALLADPEIDVVYVSVPNSLHAEWTVRAAQAGKHVLCEKPLTLSLDECDRVIDAAESAGVVVAEAVMYLYHPLLLEAGKLVKAGAVGQVTLVRGAFSFFLDRLDNVRWQPELGGGSLWDLGSYPISFIRFLVGDPVEVFGWQMMSASGVDATFAGLLRYETGVLGVFDCGFRQQFRVQAEITGTGGTLVVQRPYLITGESRILLRQGFEEREIVLPEANPYQCEVEALQATILEGSPLPVSPFSSRSNVATLVALYESARLGKSQPVCAL
jgi:predicted dehydrogenase